MSAESDSPCTCRLLLLPVCINVCTAPRAAAASDASPGTTQLIMRITEACAFGLTARASELKPRALAVRARALDFRARALIAEARGFGLEARAVGLKARSFVLKARVFCGKARELDSRARVFTSGFVADLS